MVAAIRPVPEFGSNTNSSMTRSLFGPNRDRCLVDETSCTEPWALVWMRSRCTTLAPIWMIRTPAPGARLWDAGLTAPAVPTTSAWACRPAPLMTRAAAEERRARRAGKDWIKGMGMTFRTGSSGRS
jgi:hypothetical protein